MEIKLKEWQHFYNWMRPHGAHGGGFRWNATSSNRKKRHSVKRSLHVTSLNLKTIERAMRLSINTQRLRRAS